MKIRFITHFEFKLYLYIEVLGWEVEFSRVKKKPTAIS